jgi:hypothetical protein
MRLWSSSAQFVIAGAVACAALGALGRWRLPHGSPALTAAYGVFFGVPYGAGWTYPTCPRTWPGRSYW